MAPAQQAAPRHRPAPGVERGSARRVAGNAFTLGLATIVARIAMFGLGVAMANALGPADYGRYGIGVSLAIIFIPVVDLGLTPYITREVARAREETEEVLGRIVRARIAMSLAGALLAAALVVLLVRDPRTEWALLLVLASAVFDGVAQFGFAYFQGLERMRSQALVTTSSSLARAVGGVALVLLFDSLALVLVWLLAVSLLQAAWVMVGLRRRPRPARTAGRAAGRIDWRTVLAMGLVTVLVAVVLRVDSVLVGALRSEGEAGLYTAAWTLMGGVQVVPWMVAVALTPVLARTFAAERPAFVTALGHGIRSVLLVSAPLALLLCLLAGPVIERFFGDTFGPAATALAILVWSMPLAAVNALGAAALRGAGRERALTFTVAAGAAVNVACNLVAIQRFGINGAASVNVATEAVLLVAMCTLLHRMGVLPLPRLSLPRLALALGGLAAAAVLLRGLVPVELAMAASGLVYVAVVWLTRLVTRDDLEAVRRRH